MKEEGYIIRDQKGIYFITFATVQWVDVFSRYCYIEILLESLRHCIKEKGLNVHAWCLMSNHIHLILSAKNGNFSDVLRDFKKYISRKITNEIETNTQESRRSWMLWNEYQFWQQNNRPIQLDCIDFTLTKLEYIHANPVKAGLVERSEDYLLSSARDYNGTSGLLPIEHLSAAFSLRKPG